jgi:predicted extracellular nuclease
MLYEQSKVLRKWTSLTLAAVLTMSPLAPSSVPKAKAADSAIVVISEAYGGGGNSGAALKSDFVELYNPTESAVDITGWTLQYASASGSFSALNSIPLSGSIQPHSYYLVKAADGSGGTTSLPSPDASGGIAMSATSGKVALVTNGEPITGKEDPNVMDFVGYGSANLYEGNGAAPVLSNTISAQRKSDFSGYAPGKGSGHDTGSNAADFFAGTPDPKNAESPAEPPLEHGAVAGVAARPPSGAVEAGTRVSLSTPTVSAVVYYSVYASDGTLMAAEQLYSAPIVIEEPTVIQAYAQKSGIRSEIGTFSYSVIAMTTIAEARVMDPDSTVIIEGVVTYKETSGGQNNLYVQDGTAGIVVRGPDLAPIAGDRVRVTGLIKDYFGLAQLQTTADQVEIPVPQAGVPAPAVIDSRGFAEDNEGRLVKIENAAIDSGNEYNEFSVQDDYGTLIVKSALVEESKTYDQIVGVLTYSFGSYMLIPRSRLDVVEETFSVITDPAPGIVAPGTQVRLFSPQPGAVIYYTMDGSTPEVGKAERYDKPILVNDGELLIQTIAVNGGQVSDVYSFRYVKQKTYTDLQIHDIQGAAHQSPLAGHRVEGLKGIVTHRIGSGKFYLQTETGGEDRDPRTSEAILVLSSYGVAPGDLVLVDGTVAEIKEDGYPDANDLPTTAIVSPYVAKLSGGHGLPAPVALEKDRLIPKTIIDNDGMSLFDPDEDALDFYESLESMRIELRDARVVGPLDYEIPVVLGEQSDEIMTARGGIMLTPNDINPQRVLVTGASDIYTTGDRFNGPIIGILGYDYSNYKVIPAGRMPGVTKGPSSPEKTTIAYDENKLTIASFNIENYWDDPSQAGSDKKRGIAEKLVNNLKSPDIIGLIEVQDNNGQTDDGTTDASQSYSALIQAIQAAGGPSYAFTDIAPENNEDGGAPGGNIRVGFLYNSERVTLADKPKGGARTAVSYGKDGLSVNPGRISPEDDAFDSSRKPLAAEFEFRGERVVVINNHFNSKGGDEAPYGAVQPLPETLGSEVQRHKIAALVNGFVENIMKKDKKAHVVVLGDLNDFPFSRTLEIMKGDELTNLVESLPANDRYSYIYQGNSQTLDHVLVNHRLAQAAELDIVHMNADYNKANGRVSDHDPLLVQLDLLAKGNGNEHGNGNGYGFGIGNGNGPKK